MRLIVSGLIAAYSMSCIPASAQWIDHRTPGIPRTKDGKPDLAAPTPRTREGKPDLSGIWQLARRQNPATAAPEIIPDAGGDVRPGNNGLHNYLPDGATVPLQPWAQALYRQRVDSLGIGLSSSRCLPHGLPGAMLIPIPFKIVQTPALTTILFEEFNYYRQIFTDGRAHPSLLNPTWFGYSIGKWDKDTLVVDTIGFNDQTWLDTSGYPHTEALHTTERFVRRDFGHMDVLVTIDDPKAYTKPWSPTLHLALMPDTELIEHICENERDGSHMVGK